MLHEVPNDLKLSILRNQVIPRKFLKCLEVMAITQLVTQKPNRQMLRLVLKTFYRKNYITLLGGRGWVWGWGLGRTGVIKYQNTADYFPKIPLYRRIFFKIPIPNIFTASLAFVSSPGYTKLYSHREKANTSFEFTNKTFRLFQACYCLVGVIVVSCTRNIVSTEVRFSH